MSELISVVIPVYKVEEYLEKCVNSVCNQTYSELEIILVDDGSPDKCPEMCDELKEKDPRIKVIHKTNGGPSSARNAGIAIASGKYIMFVDSDDYILPDMVEQLYYILMDSNTKIACCSCFVDEIDAENGIQTAYRKFTAEEALKCILTEKHITTAPWEKLYYSELFDTLSFPENIMYEDFALIYLIIDKAESVSFVDIRKYRYTQNPDSLMHSRFNSKCMDYFITAEKINDFLRQKYPKLVMDAKNRNTRYAVSFYKQACETGFEDKKIMHELVKRIRSSTGHYMLSHYPADKKMAALVISICPQLARKVFVGAKNSIDAANQ